MDALEETLTGLFTEIAIIEHLTRSRVANNYMDGEEPWFFGILNYFVRNHRAPDTIGGIAWSFQDDEAVVVERVAFMEAKGYLTVTPPGSRDPGAIVDVTEAGRARRQEMLDKIAPDFRQLVSEIEPDRLETAYEVLREIRLTMDNLPDR
jgi:DNA-binding MarR family transcriptional regulator